MSFAERTARVGNWQWDFTGQRLHWSDEVYKIFGLQGEEIPENLQAFLALTHLDDREYLQHAVELAITQRKPYNIVQRILRADGDECIVRECAEVLFDEAGQPLRMIGTLRDITERRRTKEDLKLTSQVFESSIEGIVITDAMARILRVNKAFCDITGYTEQEVVGNDPSMLKSGRHDEMFYQNMWRRLNEEGRWHGEVWNRRKGGEIYPEWLAIKAVKDESGKVKNYIAMFDDISEQKAAEERIERLAYYDALTELPNRVMFHGRLQMAMAAAQRNEYQVAILSLDLDRFKNINETLGPPIGDELLQKVAERLKANLHVSDMVARFGGDEFVIMLSELHHEREVVHIAGRIMQAISEPFQLQEHEVFVTCSMGIAVYPADDGKDDLLKNADTAMFHAKEKGRNNYQFYRTEMNLTAVNQLFIESSLHRAQERCEFMLYYQPQVALDSGEITGVESLMRWRHPELGQVGREKFIPALEDTGLIISVGEWVLRTACAQQVAWRKAGFKPLKVAVNLSPQQFARSDLFDMVSRVVAESGIDPQYLELEITEGSLMKNAEESSKTLQRLKEMGIRLSIDDFGTGYSSLSYLKRFPIDTLKIDRSFIQGVDSNTDDAAIASTVIAMGHSLNLRVLAEGVETKEQLAFLSEHNCNDMQGYLFSRPVPPDRIDVLLKESHTLADCT